MMTLYEKIIALYPQLTEQDFVKLIVLQNDGDEKEDYIASWNYPTLTRPTDEQLA
jgi:phenolic acid decarboxylase